MGGGFFASQAYGKKYADKANGVFLFFFLSMISLRRKSTAEKYADKAKSVVIFYLFIKDFCLFCNAE